MPSSMQPRYQQLTSLLVLGGARSGKSRRALTIAEQSSDQRIFIATAECLDEEMHSRIELHRADRGIGWQTIEEPVHLVMALAESAAPDQVCVVDCLTLWLSNLLHRQLDVELETKELCAALEHPAGPVVLVSNEVGMGIVPGTSLGRKFRDAQGRLNQAVANVCDRVELVTAGLPLLLKG